MTHTSVCRRRTGMPRVEARSARSADAEDGDAERRAPRGTGPAPGRHAGTTIMVRTSVALNVMPPIGELGGERLGHRCCRTTCPRRPGAGAGRRRSAAGRCRSWPRSAPGGSGKNRRMISVSTSTPSRIDAARPTTKPEPVVPAPGQDQHHRQRGGHRAEVALGEVDDPVGAVDEGDAQRDEGDAAADQGAVEHDAHGRREQHLL